MCTDFSAQVDLRPNKTTTCHVDQHLVLGIFFVFHNRRLAMLQTREEISVLDCDVFHCVGNCNDNRIKNDFDFHLSCIDFIVRKYQVKYENTIEVLIVWTDNCAAQYKGRRTFFNYGMLKDSIWINTIDHRFSEVNVFKGPWD